MGVFLDFPDCSFCLFVFSDTFLHCLNCLGFAIWYSISCCSFFWDFFFFFCNLYFFHVHFITKSSNFTSTSTDISLGVPLYFCINLGKFDIFTIVSPYSHRSVVSLHYFSFFYNFIHKICIFLLTDSYILYIFILINAIFFLNYIF